MELLLEHGLNRLTTAKIARRSNTAETILYRHFSGKNEIMAEVLKKLCQQMRQQAESILAEPILPVQKLEKISLMHLVFIKRTKGISRLLFSELIHLADSQDPIKVSAREYLQDYKVLVRRIIEEGKLLKHFDAGLDEEMASQSFIGLHYMCLLEWSVNDFAFDPMQYHEKVNAFFLKTWAVN